MASKHMKSDVCILKLLMTIIRLRLQHKRFHEIRSPKISEILPKRLVKIWFSFQIYVIIWDQNISRRSHVSFAKGITQSMNFQKNCFPNNFSVNSCYFLRYIPDLPRYYSIFTFVRNIMIEPQNKVKWPRIILSGAY